MNIIKRDDEFFELTFKTIDGDPVDLTDGTVYFTVKKRKTDADEDALISKEITEFYDATGGIAVLELTNEETDIGTGLYYFDIQFVDSRDKVMSMPSSVFTVSQDITVSLPVELATVCTTSRYTLPPPMNVFAVALTAVSII